MGPQSQVSSANPKSKFTVFPTSLSPSYDKSIDTVKTGPYSSSGFPDESYCSNTFKSSRESFNIRPDHKNTKSVTTDNSGQKYQEHKCKNGYSEFQRESVPQVAQCNVRCYLMYIQFTGKFSLHSYCISSHALMLTI